ncbi:MAG: nucleoside kinase [Bacteroidales bacterium]|nr:nucleoside kinase [Bacteroidales bacterium]
MIQVYCKNTGTYKSFREGTTLLDMLPAFVFDKPYPIVSAKVNNVSQGLKFRVYNNRDIEFTDATSPNGMRVYNRSLFFLLCKAAHDVFRGSQINVEHPISHGYYCELHKADGSKTTAQDVEKIKARMLGMVERDLNFHRFEVHTEEAIRIFREKGHEDKARLLETSGQVYMDYYTLGRTADYYYGRLVPSTGYLKVWNLQLFHEGMLLRGPDKHDPSKVAPYLDQPKTFRMFKENRAWNEIMGLRTVGDLNLACQQGHGKELIQIAEALQEKKIVQIAEEISKRFHGKGGVRLVLITGPSSSGKTTVSQRLAVQLKACGLRPLTFSTDDYFVNRVDTPKLPDGSYDFDNFDTVDHKALQKDLLKLLAGEEVLVPEYNFVTGIREYKDRRYKLGPNNVIVVEGIHALNPSLTNMIPNAKKYRIFISTLTSIALDNHNCIPTSDNRLLRRIVRDSYKGAFTARETIAQWPLVRKAEDDWIYPYQENADVMFNSAYLVEFAVLRNHAEPILESIPKNCPEYAEAHRLLKFIHYFTPVPDNEIPATSLLREFVGGSSFTYPR